MVPGLIAGTILIVVLMLPVLVQAPTRYNWPTEVGLIIKRVDKKAPTDRPIARNAEAGRRSGSQHCPGYA